MSGRPLARYRPAVNRLLSLCSIAALSLSLACDSGEKKAPKKDPAAKGAKKGDAKKSAGDVKAGDAKAGDAKAGDAKAGDAKAGDAKAAEKHFKIEDDKSGILARSAAVLETDEAIDGEDLRELSHHAEKLASVEDVCRHVAKIRGTGDDIKACVKASEHHIVKIGPEIYAQLAQCIMDSKTTADLDACDAAEKEAETLLHEKAHGDGLDEATCDGFFTHFEKLAMDDAGDQADLVKEILEEVRADVVSTCVDQGIKAEVDCAMKSKTMHEVKECASKLL